MAYVIVHKRANAASEISLEGRPLREGGPLWVPVERAPTDFARAWLEAAFIAVDAAQKIFTVALPDERRVSLRLAVGIRRREHKCV